MFSGAPKKKPVKVGTSQTVDMQTGDVLETRPNAWMLIPCAPDVCQECAVDHPHGYPHNQQSLYYQMGFMAKHGRFPTWTEAMAHCAEPVRAEWRELLIAELEKNGMDVPADLLEATGQGGR
jgi:hypothetical protein